MSELANILNGDLLIVDVESNGLWGQPFAVGSVRMTSGGRVLETYTGRCNIDEVPDEWIEKNKIEERLINFPLKESPLHLVRDFWNWRREDLPMFVDCGFPVDVRFLNLMAPHNKNNQTGFYSPYPLYDISSIIMSAGESPLVDRYEYAKELIGETCGTAHNPLWDAEVSGLCAIRALRKLQALHGKR